MTARHFTSLRPDNSAILWTLAMAGIWLVAALLRPNTTMHLGPLLVPIVPAMIGLGPETTEGGDTRWLVAAAQTLVASAMAIEVLLILGLTGDLNGPALAPFRDGAQESIVLLAIGTVIGLVISTRKR